MSTNNIDKLIDSLSDDLCEKRNTMCCPMQRFLIWLILSSLVTVGFIYYAGLRPDINAKLQDSTFLLELTIALSMSLTAALSSFSLCIPDKAGKDWLIPVPLTLLAVFTLWGVLKALTGGFIMPELKMVHCIENASWLVVLPATLITFITAKKTATVNPLLLISMNALAAGGISYAALRLTCMMDTIGHDLVYHITPFLMLGMGLGLIARRLYRW